MLFRKGFSLAELIIVVLIIGIMTFIAVPRVSYSIISAGKAKTTAHKLTAALRYTRSLAIANAAENPQGFSLNMTGSGNYTGYQIINLSTNDVNETGTIPQGITCTGADDFIFGPLGNRIGDTDGLTVTANGKTFVISVVSATGMVKCEQQ